jgi:hypothetical protein
MIELPGWALEQDSDYTNIMTPENDEIDDWGSEPRIDSPRTSDPRMDSPRSTFIPEPHLFWATMNQDQGDSKEISPRNTEPRNNQSGNKLKPEPTLPQEYSKFRILFEQPK